MSPGPGNFSTAIERLRLFTSGQPQMYAMRPTAATYSGVITVPAGVPAISAGFGVAAGLDGFSAVAAGAGAGVSAFWQPVNSVRTEIATKTVPTLLLSDNSFFD